MLLRPLRKKGGMTGMIAFTKAFVIEEERPVIFITVGI